MFIPSPAQIARYGKKNKCITTLLIMLTLESLVIPEINREYKKKKNQWILSTLYHWQEDFPRVGRTGN